MRLGSYSQESTRYCNYSKDKFDNQLTFIIPRWTEIKEGIYTSNDGGVLDRDKAFLASCLNAECAYNELVRTYGCRAEEARDILPLCTKTEINVKYNLREWRHFFELRCSSKAHPEIRLLARTLLKEFHNKIPLIFDELYERYIEQPDSAS